MAEKVSTAASSGGGEPAGTAVPVEPTGSAGVAGDREGYPDPNRTVRRSGVPVERVLGVAANVAGIVGALVSLRSGQLVWLLPSIAVAGYLLYAVWHRHWAAAGASLLVFVVLAGTGYITAADGRASLGPSPVVTRMGAGEPSAGQESTSGGGGPSVAGSSAAASPPSTVSPAPDGDPATTAAGAQPRVMEITLPRHAAVDVDRPGQPVVGNQAGVTGAFDLYHDAGEVRSDSILTPDGLFSYPIDSGVDALPALPWLPVGPADRRASGW